MLKWSRENRSFLCRLQTSLPWDAQTGVLHVTAFLQSLQMTTGESLLEFLPHLTYFLLKCKFPRCYVSLLQLRLRPWNLHFKKKLWVILMCIIIRGPLTSGSSCLSKGKVRGEAEQRRQSSSSLWFTRGLCWAQEHSERALTKIRADFLPKLTSGSNKWR